MWHLCSSEVNLPFFPRMLLRLGLAKARGERLWLAETEDEGVDWLCKVDDEEELGLWKWDQKLKLEPELELELESEFPEPVEFEESELLPELLAVGLVHLISSLSWTHACAIYSLILFLFFLITPDALHTSELNVSFLGV